MSGRGSTRAPKTLHWLTLISARQGNPRRRSRKSPALLKCYFLANTLVLFSTRFPYLENSCKFSNIFSPSPRSFGKPPRQDTGVVQLVIEAKPRSKRSIWGPNLTSFDISIPTYCCKYISTSFYSLPCFDFINSVFLSIFIMISQPVIFVTENFFLP